MACKSSLRYLLVMSNLTLPAMLMKDSREVMLAELPSVSTWRFHPVEVLSRRDSRIDTRW